MKGKMTHRLEVRLVLLHQILVNHHLRGLKRGRSNEIERIVSDDLAREPKEGLLEVVVRLRRDFEVLQVLLPVEGDVRSLHFPLLFESTHALALPSHFTVCEKGKNIIHLDVDLVTTKHDGDVLADTLEVAVPVGHVLVRDTRRDVEHDDPALALDVVSIA